MSTPILVRLSTRPGDVYEQIGGEDGGPMLLINRSAQFRRDVAEHERAAEQLRMRQEALERQAAPVITVEPQ